MELLKEKLVIKNINYEKFSIVELLFNDGSEEQIFGFLNALITNTLTNVAINPELFEKLPEELQRYLLDSKDDIVLSDKYKINKIIPFFE